MNDRKDVHMNVGCCPKTHFDRAELYKMLHNDTTASATVSKGDALLHTPVVLLPIGYCEKPVHTVKQSGCSAAHGECPCTAILEKIPSDSPWENRHMVYPPNNAR